MAYSLPQSILNHFNRAEVAKAQFKKMKPQTNKLASEIVGSALANALRHSPGFMVGSLSEVKKGLWRDGKLNVEAYVAAFVGSMKLDDRLAKEYSTWRRVA
jgi:hypothetical protein